ncbi:MAG: SUMF1/EgtB/PvdO family nonheme iron enzyme [Armatimonadota bacterium]|nr:SUMF1/EgtB/PvdO family nonheme iron enzyme [Armatimonadota bacterium]
MKKVFAVTAAAALLCLGGIAEAVVMETVTVGDPGNVADTRNGTPGYGSVGYTYNIGKYEVTAAQYTDFLNKVAKTDIYGLYNIYMDTVNDHYGCNIKRSGVSGKYSYSVAPDRANRPVNLISFWDACRFANWLNNGQPTGFQDASTTERGAYTLDGYNGDDGHYIQRNTVAKWAVTSEDEWHKAAYYKGGGTNTGYWDYPTQSDTAPSNVGADGYTDPGNHANYYKNDSFTIGYPYYRTNVGEFENSASPCGTFDQDGNVEEWNEALVSEGSTTDYAFRGLRGGSYNGLDYYAKASVRYHSYPSGWGEGFGFRIVALSPPVIPIIIDIRPGSDQNNINLRSRGVVPVAVLTTDEFDASSIDPASCRFAGAAPLRWAMQDVNRDGHQDLILHFDTQHLNLSADAVTATLTGETRDGQAVEGTDNVRIVPPAR